MAESCADSDEQGGPVITTADFHSHLSDLTAATPDHYGYFDFLSEDIFAKVIFGEAVELRKEVESLIVDSFFTNNIVSEANVFMMFVALLNVVVKKRRPIERQFMKTLDTTVELLSKINEHNIGDILENFYI